MVTFHPLVLYENVDHILTLTNMHYKMCIQWTRVLYVVITWQSIPPISNFNSPCNEFTSVWSMFVYNNNVLTLSKKTPKTVNSAIYWNGQYNIKHRCECEVKVREHFNGLPSVGSKGYLWAGLTVISIHGLSLGTIIYERTKVESEWVKLCWVF